MRLVLDTNTALSGLLWDGTPGRLIEAAMQKQIELVISPPLVAELRDVLSRTKFARRLARLGFIDIVSAADAEVRINSGA